MRRRRRRRRRRQRCQRFIVGCNIVREILATFCTIDQRRKRMEEHLLLDLDHICPSVAMLQPNVYVTTGKHTTGHCSMHRDVALYLHLVLKHLEKNI